jgi:hypothetical protein
VRTPGQAAHDAAVQMIDTSIVRVHQHGARITLNVANASPSGPGAPLASAMAERPGLRFHGKNRSLAGLPQA